MPGTNTFRGGNRARKDLMQDNSVKDHLHKTFDIDYRSEMDNERYVGQFTIKKLSVRDMGRLGTRRSQLNGGMYYDEENPGVGIDEQTNATNNTIAHLELSIVQAPTWWNMEEVYDFGLLTEVFKNVADFENSFFRSNGPEKTADAGGGSEANSNGEDKGTGAAGHIKKVGGGEVQPSLDP